MKQEYQQQLCSCGKMHGTVLDGIRLYPNYLDVVQSIFWVLFVRTKVEMNSLFKFKCSWSHFSELILPFQYFIFFTNLW